MTKWNKYTAKELKPRGWIKKQMQIQADGLSGNLDKVWPDIRDSAWIGGDRDGWERVPYWLDGFVPLAYLLENEDMIARAKKYVYAIIDAQKEDGWICPISSAEAEQKRYDTWALQLLSKSLTVYYECSGDDRIPPVLYKALKNYYLLLKSGRVMLYDWSKYRWFEACIAINCIYDIYKEDWLLELVRILKEQGTDYAELVPYWERPINRWSWETHIVNIAMMLKEEAVACDLLGEPYTDKAEMLRAVLAEKHGTVYESFTGDECLSGISPIQGTELCAIVEQMYSYELLYAYTGDVKWAERLEVLAFNALPATISEDMWTHQYVQMSNQIACQRFPGRPIFRTNEHEAHLFGLEPNCGCCTANFNQGWPKLALSAFLHKDNTVLHAMMLPAEIHADKWHITAQTEYPFENSVNYDIKAEEDMTFKVRIPSFARNIKCNIGSVADGELVVCIKGGEHKCFTLQFEVEPCFEKRPNELYAVRCGSLLFSVPIKYNAVMHEYERNGVERRFPYCDYELVPQSEWNYAYCKDQLGVVRKGVADAPFSEKNPPVTIKAKLCKIDWDFEDGYETVCAKTPRSTVPLSSPQEMELYPYACAKLRMTELPLLDEMG